MDKRFDQLDNASRTCMPSQPHVRLSTSDHCEIPGVDQLCEFSEGEQRRMTERMDELEQRVAKVEKKLES